MQVGTGAVSAAACEADLRSRLDYLVADYRDATPTQVIVPRVLRVAVVDHYIIRRLIPLVRVPIKLPIMGDYYRPVQSGEYRHPGIHLAERTQNNVIAGMAIVGPIGAIPVQNPAGRIQVDVIVDEAIVPDCTRNRHKRIINNPVSFGGRTSPPNQLLDMLLLGHRNAIGRLLCRGTTTIVRLRPRRECLQKHQAKGIGIKWVRSLLQGVHVPHDSLKLRTVNPNPMQPDT